MFIDHIHLTVQAGDGGNGCESYYRRPDKKILSHGGDGGHGGGVIFRADTNAQPLSQFRFKQHLIAESGGHGSSDKKRGRNGKDLVIMVQPGTRIFDRQRNLHIRDLRQNGDQVVVIEGGRGGSGNFGGKTATQGEKGTALELDLFMRLTADVFLIGLPNSGKSRLLNLLSGAHIKEGEYPFSTTHPELGVWAFSDYERLTVCDMPSLYASSHEGRGMGNKFLVHLENAPFIFYVLDPVSAFATSLENGLNILKEQLGKVDPDYLKIPHAVLINKIDLVNEKNKKDILSFNPEAPCFFISCETKDGLNELSKYMQERFAEKIKGI